MARVQAWVRANPPLAAMGGVLGVLVVAVIMWSLLGGKPNPPPTPGASGVALSTPTGSPTPSAAGSPIVLSTLAPPATPSAAERILAGLKARVPSTYADSCTDKTGTSSAYDGSIASLSCSAPGVDGIWYDLFANAAALATFHANTVAKYRLAVDESANCSSGNLDVPYSYTFPDGAKWSGEGWRLLCFKPSTNAWLEQFIPAIGIVVTVRVSSGDQAVASTWWGTNPVALIPHP